MTAEMTPDGPGTSASIPRTGFTCSESQRTAVRMPRLDHRVTRRVLFSGAAATAVGMAASLTPELAFAASPGATTWMTALGDAVPLGQLSIPGTHDSASFYAWMGPGRCQFSTIAEQLAMGVRFLDIRVYRSGSQWALCHGSMATGDWFGPAVATPVRDFLAAHPGETVVMSIKEDSGAASGSNAQTMAAIWSGYRSQYPGLFLTGPGPWTLGQSRGKVVTIGREGLDGQGTTMSWNQAIVPTLEDAYHVDTQTQVTTVKLPVVKANIQRAWGRDAAHAQSLFVSFASCTSYDVWWNTSVTPGRAAEILNPQLQTWLSQQPSSQPDRGGIIPVDFVQPDLAAQIGARNFGRSTWV